MPEAVGSLYEVADTTGIGAAMSVQDLPLPAPRRVPCIRRGISAALISLAAALLVACSGARSDDGFQLFQKKADADPAIWSALSAKGADAVADPGEPCERGCIRTGHFPDMCMLFGGQSSTHVFLVYQQGTILLRTMLVVFELQGDDAEIVWHDDLSSYAETDVPGLRQAIEQGASPQGWQSRGAALVERDGARLGITNSTVPFAMTEQQCGEDQ